MKRCVVPGSFDPITLGHIDMITRAGQLFDEVTVLLLKNDAKRGMFTEEQRLNFLQSSVADIKNARVESYDGLLCDYLRQNSMRHVVRGVRNTTDFNAEMLYFAANRAVMPEIEILFMPSPAHLSHISSSLIREILSYSGDAGKFVPKQIDGEIKRLTGHKAD